MIRLILTMVLLFSATAATENIKYKRDDADNMHTHIKCYYMAKSIKLSAARIDIHQKESMGYTRKVWAAYSDKERGHNGMLSWYLGSTKYFNGWVDGFFANLSAAEQSGVYYGICEDDQLLFSLEAK